MDGTVGRYGNRLCPGELDSSTDQRGGVHLSVEPGGLALVSGCILRCALHSSKVIYEDLVYVVGPRCVNGTRRLLIAVVEKDLVGVGAAGEPGYPDPDERHLR